MCSKEMLFLEVERKLHMVLIKSKLTEIFAQIESNRIGTHAT